MNNVLTIGDVSGMLLGAGLVKLNSELNIALLLIGVGVALKILVAVLNRNNIPVSSK